MWSESDYKLQLQNTYTVYTPLTMTIVICEVCLEQFNSSNHKPLIICKHGHTICSACRSRVSTCPTCRAWCSSRQVTNTALLTARDSLVSFKFLLLGESGVGKSSLMMRFTEGELQADIAPTVGLDFRVRMMNLMGFSVKLCVWLPPTTEAPMQYYWCMISPPGFPLRSWVFGCWRRPCTGRRITPWR